MTPAPAAPPGSPPDHRPTLDLDWVKTAAGALAAVTTAVLLSTLGAAGTLLGAALGSVAATVGSALYAQGLARSRAAVLKAQEAALRQVGIAQAEVRRAGRRSDDPHAAEAHLDHADERLSEARAELDQPGPGAPSLAGRVRALPWKRIAVVAALTFVVALVVITGFEKAAGRSVSQVTGGSDGSSGSTVPGVNRTDDRAPEQDDRRDDDRDQQPSDEASPSEDDPEPSEEPTPSEEPSAEPSPTPSSSPTPSPTTAPSPTGSPTP